MHGGNGSTNGRQSTELYQRTICSTNPISGEYRWSYKVNDKNLVKSHILLEYLLFSPNSSKDILDLLLLLLDWLCSSSEVEFSIDVTRS